MLGEWENRCAIADLHRCPYRETHGEIFPLMLATRARIALKEIFKGFIKVIRPADSTTSCCSCRFSIIAGISNYFSLSRNMSDDPRLSYQIFVTKLINIYKQHPALWKVRSKSYANKNLKDEGYKALVDFCKTCYPDADKDFVIRKIQSMRGCFRKEIKKIENSKRSGAGPDDVYVPQLWYFDLLLFTVDQDVPVHSKDIPVQSMETGEFSYHLEDFDNISELGLQLIEEFDLELQNESRQTRQQVGFKRPFTPTNRIESPNRIKSIQKQEFKNTCNEDIEIDEFVAADITVSSKLRKMNSTQQVLAEALIHKILMKGILNELTRKTDVVENVGQNDVEHDSSSSTCASGSTTTAAVLDEDKSMTRYYVDLFNTVKEDN